MNDETTTQDLLVLRATLARELETINEYERMIAQASSPEVKALMAHLRDEEKEHVAECMEYIRRLDKVQDKYFGGTDLDAHFGGTPRSAAPPAPGPDAPSPPVKNAFTVGSLKGQRDF